MEIGSLIILADGLLPLAHRLPSARHAGQLTGRRWTQHSLRSVVDVSEWWWSWCWLLVGFPRHEEERI